VRFFDQCMTKHEFDSRIMDFTWKQNRLSKDKEQLKSAMLHVIRKKPKKQDGTATGNEKGAGANAS